MAIGLALLVSADPVTIGKFSLALAGCGKTRVRLGMLSSVGNLCD